MRKKNTVMVVDAQGGGLGRQLITSIRKELPDVRIIAVGTNSAATANMLKAGADEAATGENAIRVVGRMVDFIIGPIGMVIADDAWRDYSGNCNRCCPGRGKKNYDSLQQL